MTLLSEKNQKPKNQKESQNIFSFFITKHWKIALISIIIISGTIIGLTGFIATRPQPTDAKLTMPTIIPGSFNTSVAKQFGGPIKTTIDCSLKTSCLQNPICTVVNCILQIPFIFQVFDNKSTQAGDAFETLREEVLEPQEDSNCKELCSFKNGWYAALSCAAQYNYAGCPEGWSKEKCYCQLALPAMQKKNISPVGIQTALFKKTMSGMGMQNTAMAFILFPDPGMPPCSATGNILGQGYGTTVFFTTPGGLTPVGDNCRGSYYTGGGK